jgi:nucleotide-binding universal stress UspA family protein
MEPGMRVLVATDLSDGADTALREGAALAATSNDALAIVHALPQPSFVGTWTARPSGDAEHRARRAHQLIDERVSSVLGRPVEAYVYAAILTRAETWSADIVVLGSHGPSGIARAFGGSVVDRVVRHAPRSVLVARASKARGWVLAASGLSKPSLGAVAAAAVEARRRQARLEVVHAMGFLDAEARYLLELVTPAVDPEPPSVFEVAARELARCIGRLQIDAKCKVLDRPAAAAIVGEADAIGAELVVVGARGKTGLGRLVPGGVAEHVARTASCSVLIARPGAHA